MVNHCEACDSYKTCDKRPSALLPAVYVKQVHSIFLTAGLKPESEMRSLELPRPCWCYLPTSDPSKVFQEKKKQTKKCFQISLHLRLNQSRELQFPPTVRTKIKKKNNKKAIWKVFQENNFAPEQPYAKARMRTGLGGSASSWPGPFKGHFWNCSVEDSNSVIKTEQAAGG